MTAAVARCVRKRRSTALCRAAAPFGFVFMARGVQIAGTQDCPLETYLQSAVTLALRELQA